MKRINVICRDCKRAVRLPKNKTEGGNWLKPLKLHTFDNVGVPFCLNLQ